MFEYLGSGSKVPTEKKRISTLYRCLFVPETKNRKSNFMLILCSVYAIMILCCYDNLTKSLCYYAVMIT